MTEERDYLWDQRGPGDPFAVELERRLAPLDDADALVEALELDEGPDESGADDDAVVLVLHEGRSGGEPRSAEPTRRSWPLLAAAIAVLGLSVGVLASESREAARDHGEIGAGEGAGHVVITAPDRSIHELLRPAHAGLSACALALAPEVVITLQVSGGDVEILEAPSTIDAGELQRCVERSLADLGLAESTPLELELRSPERQL